MAEYVTFGNTAAEVPTEYLVEVIELVSADYLADIAKRDDLSPKHKRFLKQEAESFRANMESFKQTRNSAAKESGMRAILAALNFSIYHRGGSAALENFRRDVKGGHTKNAIEANRHTEINDIISDEVARFEAGTSGRVKTRRGIAMHIAPKVVERIRLLPNPPKDWLFVGNLSNDQHKQVGNRILAAMKRLGIGPKG